MHIRSSGIFNKNFAANLQENLTVKKFRKSVENRQSYCHEFGVSVFWNMVYMCMTTHASKDVSVCVIHTSNVTFSHNCTCTA